MDGKFCQSCGMQMTTPEKFGTKKNGETSTDFFYYCYRNGEFESWCKNMTINEMVKQHTIRSRSWNCKDS